MTTFGRRERRAEKRVAREPLPAFAMNRLRDRLIASYAVLDPMMPDEGKFLARWRLRLNVEPEEIESAVRT